MGVMASQITSPTIVYSTVFQVQFKENIKAPLAFVRGIIRLFAVSDSVPYM